MVRQTRRKNVIVACACNSEVFAFFWSRFAGHASGSMTVDWTSMANAQAGEGVETGKFDLTLTWQDGSGTNHTAAASISFENALTAPPPG